MLIWTVLCGLLTVVWISQDVTKESALAAGSPVAVDETFRLTLTTASPPTFKIENTTTKNATFSYSNVKMTDTVGTRHAPKFAMEQLSDEVPASGAITKTLDFGNLGSASATSYHWACDACAAGQAIGRTLVFIMMGVIYWFGMLVLFIVWLVSRPPRVVQVIVSQPPTENTP